MLYLGKVMIYHCSMNTTSHSIKRAAKLLGSQLALARALQVTPVTVSQWTRDASAKNARPVPPKQCVRIEKLTSGQVSRRELRPEDWQDIWPELAQQPAEQGA